MSLLGMSRETGNNPFVALGFLVVLIAAGAFATTWLWDDELNDQREMLEPWLRSEIRKRHAGVDPLYLDYLVHLHLDEALEEAHVPGQIGTRRRHYADSELPEYDREDALAALLVLVEEDLAEPDLKVIRAFELQHGGEPRLPPSEPSDDELPQSPPTGPPTS